MMRQFKPSSFAWKESEARHFFSMESYYKLRFVDWKIDGRNPAGNFVGKIVWILIKIFTISLLTFVCF